MKLLVAGADPVDAGKTTFAAGLVDRTDAPGFKPRAGNDRWFDHDDYRDAVSEGRLYGKDARRLADAAPDDRKPESINPIHRLWQPAPGGGKGVVGRAGREFVLDRVGDRYVVNTTAELPPLVRDRLPTDDAITVSSLDELNAVTADYHLPALADCRQQIAAADRAVIESYGDVARPLREIDADAAAVVEPGRVRVYDGGRFLKTADVVGTSASGAAHGQLEERVSDVLDHVEPTATVSLPPLSSDERADPAAVAEAYEVAYDAVLAAALD